MKENDIRPEIMEFAKQMEMTMSSHDGHWGNTWKDCHIDVLEDSFEETFGECRELFIWDDRILQEFVDLANICMMLCHRHFGIKNKKEEATDE